MGAGVFSDRSMQQVECALVLHGKPLSHNLLKRLPNPSFLCQHWRLVSITNRKSSKPKLVSSFCLYSMWVQSAIPPVCGLGGHLKWFLLYCLANTSATNALCADSHGFHAAVWSRCPDFLQVWSKVTSGFSGDFGTNTAEILRFTASLDRVTFLRAFSANVTPACHDCIPNITFDSFNEPRSISIDQILATASVSFLSNFAQEKGAKWRGFRPRRYLRSGIRCGRRI